MRDQLKVSYIVTIFNKAHYIPYMVQSIKSQKLNCNKEYIFIDDASTDYSIRVLEQETADMDNVTIIKNTDNKGPSIRLNQGAAAATGDYLHLLDGDEILPMNASKIMLDLLLNNKGDFIYGKKKKTNLEPSNLLGQFIDDEIRYKVHTNPLLKILQGKFVGISLMVSKKLYEIAGGCDERIFIQDESLPVRLAHKASMFITLENTVVFSAKKTNNLSMFVTQQHHDRFLVYKYALEDFSESVPKSLQKKMYQRAISSVWKSKKKTQNFTSKLFFFLKYMKVKLFSPSPNRKELENFKAYFDSFNNIRKTQIK
ncbi:MAG: glycosyltransferase family 2 protein [Alphaproteobacteria bacterium]|nr:glycosyltransferase family 2 protein [Alphaproteobacteria bacterium]